MFSQLVYLYYSWNFNEDFFKKSENSSKFKRNVSSVLHTDDVCSKFKQKTTFYCAKGLTIISTSKLVSEIHFFNLQEQKNCLPFDKRLFIHIIRTQSWRNEPLTDEKSACTTENNSEESASKLLENIEEMFITIWCIAIESWSNNQVWSCHNISASLKS